MASVLISYYSKSGNTEAMAQILAEAVKSAGAQATVKRAEDTTNKDLVEASAVALGSPDYFSYVAGQVKIIFDEALEVKSNLSAKPSLCFLSHGGKAKGPFENLMKAVGLTLVCPCVMSQSAPAGVTVDEIKKAGKALVAALKK